jgi:Protein of unknown function (DUF3237)
MLPLRSAFLFTLTGTVASAIDIGSTPLGQRRIIPITGGSFEGPKIRGRVIPGGMDGMLIRSDAVALPDVKIVLETETLDLIFMSYGGFRHGPPAVMDRLARGEQVDPSEYYFRITPRFETGSEKLDWLNRIVAVGVGQRVQAGPIYDIYEIL